VAARLFKKLSSDDQRLRNKLLLSENKKLHALLARLEIENILLKNENLALKKHAEERASELFVGMLGKIAQRTNRARRDSELQGSNKPPNSSKRTNRKQHID
jgi:hypothetical protein